jgi:hypothetical protein
MFASEREKREAPHIVAIVELDIQKIRVRIVLAREAIKERLRELEHPKNHHGERPGIENAPDNRGLILAGRPGYVSSHDPKFRVE